MTIGATEALRVPSLRSGGLILGYACNLACRHCNYNCRPGAGPWMTEERLDAALDALAREKRLSELHLAGGEATLNPGLLITAVRKAVERGIRLSYLETNGHFAHSVDAALDTLRPLEEAGLGAVLVSVSPYHNERLPLRRTLNCLEAAVRVFGEDGVFPWLGHFIPMLAKMDPERPHSLDEFFAANRLNRRDGSLLRLFPLSPGGRVPYGLRDLFTPLPADSFRGGHCLETLSSTGHFHIDPDGNLFTGHCPGIVSGRLPDLHAEKTPANSPVFTAAARGGPYALMEIARDLYGFEPDAAGYVSPCHLCIEARGCLRRNEPGRWTELAPATFYAAQ